MTELASLLAQALPATTFRTEEGRVYSAEGLQETLSQTSGHVSETREVLSAYLEVDDVWIGSVAAHLRDRLSGYIDAGTDRIGHSFPIIGDRQAYLRGTPDLVLEIHSSSSLPGFARGLIRAAAVLGPDRAAKLVSLWTGGKPRHYKIYVVLAGVYIDESIELARIHRRTLMDGVRTAEGGG